jgi:exosortase/archaeosortase family protein
MLVVTSMVMAHVLLRSLCGKTLVSVAAIPLSIAKNGLRIFTLTALGVYVDPGFLTGRLHRHGGIVFFLISLLAVVVMICLVDRLERRTGKGPRRKEFPDVGRFAVKQESIS